MSDAIERCERRAEVRAQHASAINDAALRAHLEQEVSDLRELIELAKRAVPEYHEVAQRLYGFLDNIDTADDMAKSDDLLYRAIVRREVGKRWPLVDTCDGQTVVLVTDSTLAAQPAGKQEGRGDE